MCTRIPDWIHPKFRPDLEMVITYTLDYTGIGQLTYSWEFQELVSKYAQIFWLMRRLEGSDVD